MGFSGLEDKASGRGGFVDGSISKREVKGFMRGREVVL
jgi:hypothetical protein